MSQFQEEDNVPAFLRMFKKAENLLSSAAQSEKKGSEPSPSETFLRSLIEQNKAGQRQNVEKGEKAVVREKRIDREGPEELHPPEKMGDAFEENENEDDEFEVVAERKKPRCIVCEEKKAKYKCPSCQRQCCSIDCIRAHKIHYKCDGLKKLERYIPKAKFKKMDLVGDYKYLSSMILNTEKVQKKMSILKRKQNDDLRFKLLRIYSRKLYNIQLITMPPQMSRHRENLSFYFTKEKKIFWAVEFRLYLPDLVGRNLPRALSKPFSDSSQVGKVCGSIDFFSSEILIKYGRDLGEGVLKKIIEKQADEKKSLLFFLNKIIKPENLKLQVAEDSHFNPADRKRSEENLKYQLVSIDESCTLETILRNTMVLEYPTIYLCFEEFLEEFKRDARFSDSPETEKLR